MSILLLACGSLRRELEEVLRRNGWEAKVEYLPPDLHMSPEGLTSAVEERLKAARGQYRRVILAYGRCAPGLDDVLEQYGAERLPGEHCYHIFGDDRFESYMQEEPGTYFLTDFLCRNFHRVITGLGLDRYPKLKKAYFRNYKRVVYLDTVNGGKQDQEAREIASYLDLPLVIARVGVTGLERRLGQALEGREHQPPLKPIPGESRALDAKE